MSYMDIADLLVVTTYLKHMDTKSDGDLLIVLVKR